MCSLLLVVQYIRRGAFWNSQWTHCTGKKQAQSRRTKRSFVAICMFTFFSHVTSSMAGCASISSTRKAGQLAHYHRIPCLFFNYKKVVSHHFSVSMGHEHQGGLPGNVSDSPQLDVQCHMLESADWICLAASLWRDYSSEKFLLHCIRSKQLVKVISWHTRRHVVPGEQTAAL